MIEILFRGKLTSGCGWAEGNLNITKDGVYIITPDETPLGKYGQVIPETVGQYIGMTDKNGKKIFDGDIVRHYNEVAIGNPKTFDTGAIYWNERFFAWGRTTKSEFYYDYIRIGGDCVYEVIGNIHDNPELLERRPQ